MKVETKRKCVCVYALRIQTSTIKNSACFGNRGKHYLNAEFGEKQQRGRGKREGKKKEERMRARRIRWRKWLLLIMCWETDGSNACVCLADLTSVHG